MKSSAKATCIGLTAPVFWGTTVGLVRNITEEFSLSAGLAILYATTVAYLLFVLGVPKIKKMPLKYLLFGIPLSNACSILFCVSMYLCKNEQQTVEVGMVTTCGRALSCSFRYSSTIKKCVGGFTPGCS